MLCLDEDDTLTFQYDISGVLFLWVFPVTEVPKPIVVDDAVGGGNSRCASAPVAMRQNITTPQNHEVLSCARGIYINILGCYYFPSRSTTLECRCFVRYLYGDKRKGMPTPISYHFCSGRATTLESRCFLRHLYSDKRKGMPTPISIFSLRGISATL